MGQASFVRKLFPRLGRRAWLAIVMPFALSLSIVISVGGDLQLAFASALKSDAPSLYAGAYQEQIARFPGLVDWVLSSLDPVLFLISVFSTLIAITRRTVFRAALALGICICTILSVFDVVFFIMEPQATRGNLFVALVSNVSGGLLIGFVAIVVLKILAYTWNKSRSDKYILTLASAGIIFASIAFSAATYVVMYFLFQPTAIRIDAVLKPPASGFIMGSNERGPSEDEQMADEPPRSFSIVPPGATARAAELTATDDRPVISWVLPDRDAQVVVNLTVFLDCPPFDPFRRLPHASPHWTLAEASSLRLDLGSGQAFLFVDGAQPRNYTVDIIPGGFFWLKQAQQQQQQQQPNARRLSWQAFIQPNSRVRVGGRSPLRFYVDVPLMEFDGQHRTYSHRRSLNFTTDGRSTVVRGGGSMNLRADHRPNCRRAPLPDGQASGGAIQGDWANAFHLGVLIEFERRQNRANVYASDLGELSITGVDGPVEIFEPEFASMLDRYLGNARVLAFDGNVERVEFDGNRIELSPEDRVAAYGHFRGSVSSGGGYQFTGLAGSLWQNGRRINPTRWERLTPEIQATLLGALGVTLILLIRLVISALPRLRKDEDLFFGVNL